MRILIIIMLLCTTLVPNYLYAISHENYSEESFLFVGEDYMQENYKVTLHLSGVSVSTLFNESIAVWLLCDLTAVISI